MISELFQSISIPLVLFFFVQYSVVSFDVLIKYAGLTIADAGVSPTCTNRFQRSRAAFKNIQKTVANSGKPCYNVIVNYV